ncbi:SOS response-associated peptidase [Lapillicoccus jejuensis]|nr:SOS response-associated peptidase [Lapillicoccus jejuensis]
MCGRYAASKDVAELVLELDIELDATAEPTRSVLARPQVPPPGQPDFNMAPTKQAPVVLTRAPRGAGPDAAAVRQLRLLTWGLVPSWAKDAKVGLRMVNARAETVLEKPGFARAAASRRCLVPAQGWYEWQVSPTATDAKGKPRKQPFFMHRVDGDVVAFAGLYEFWRDRDVADEGDPAAWLTTFTIVTTAAEPGLDRIHDRQPLVLEREDWATWLAPEGTSQDEVAALLAYERPGRFDAYPVGPAVGATRNNGEQLLLPIPREELHGVVDPVTGEVVGS